MVLLQHLADKKANEMNFNQGVAAIAASAVLASLPAAVLANTYTNAPIAISDVDAAPANADGQSEGGFVAVTFENTTQLVATEVDFQLEADGAPIGTIADVGTFAPGVTIRHTFPNSTAFSDLHLSVARVEFVDGSRWFLYGSAGYYAR